MKKLLNVKIDLHQLSDGLEKLLASIRPTWKPEEIKHKVLSGGITNQLALIYLDEKDDDKILIRIYGKGSEIMIDRNAEIENMLNLHKVGLTGPLYCQFSNGLAYKFIDGKTVDENLVRDSHVYRLISKQMAEFHSVKIPPNSKALLLPKIHQFVAHLPRSFADKEKDKLLKEKYPSFDNLNKEVHYIEEFLSSFKSPLVFSHNDCLLANILYNKTTDAVHFIDFEYSGPNYQAYDIANHFCEFAGVDEYKPELYPDEAFQHAWIRTYLEAWNQIHSIEGPVTEVDVHELFLQVDDAAMIPNFLWSIWALVQASISNIDFDYLGYAIDRMDEYFNMKKKAMNRHKSQ